MSDTKVGTFRIGDYDYPVESFKMTPDEENYFCGRVELVIGGDIEPDVNPEESYVGKMKTDKGEWYFPWLWFKETPDDKLVADTHGAIFVPGNLSAEDEEKYDAINLIVASEVYMSMTEEVWKQLLLVFHDWLSARKVPQADEFKVMSDDVEVPAEPLLEYMEEDDDDSGSYSEDEEDEEDEKPALVSRKKD